VPYEASRLRGAVVRGYRVYTATARGGGRCLDAGEGGEVWHFRQPTPEDLTTPPPVVGTTVYVGSGVSFTDRDYSTVFAVSGPDGRSRSEYRTDTSVRALARGGGDRLFGLFGDSSARWTARR
jgi:outer membrane protein assembly factor BamB